LADRSYIDEGVPLQNQKISEPFAVWAYGTDTRTMFLAFRESQTPDDALMDAKTKLAPYRPPTESSVTGIQVEQGFYDVFNGSEPAEGAGVRGGRRRGSVRRRLHERRRPKNEAQCHNPCCSYSYALFNPSAPYNRGIKPCMDQSKPELLIP
jgi:hypothetical protein